MRSIVLQEAISDLVEVILKAEASDNLGNPFVLREEDLRRLVEDARRQVDDASGGVPVEVRYQVKLQDGSIVETDSLDEVIRLENGGASAIVYLSLIVTTDPVASVELVDHGVFHSARTSVGIGIRFGNEDRWSSLVFGAFDQSTIRYRVWGDDRAWVLLSKTVVEDRLSRVTRRGWGLLDAPTLVALFALMIGLVGVMFASAVVLDSKPDLSEALLAVQSAWESGEIVDPVEAVIRIEMEKLDATESPSTLTPWMILMSVVVGVMVLLNFARTRYSQRVNFIWGDQLGIHERRDRLRRSAFWMIGVAFLVAMAASWFVARLP